MNLDRTVKRIHKTKTVFRTGNGGRCGMDTAHRRMEIISILSAKGHVTMAELAWGTGSFKAHDNERHHFTVL